MAIMARVTMNGATRRHTMIAALKAPMPAPNARVTSSTTGSE